MPEARLSILGQMVAHISHEIKNTLMIIGGFARQLQDHFSGQPPEIIDKFNVIIDEIDRLENYLTQLGNYIKSSQVHRSSGDLNALIQETCRLLEPSLEASQIKLVLNLDLHPPLIKFDPILLRQVLLNIAKNSIEAMSPGGILTINSGCQQNRLFVKISDTGEGVAPEIISEIFKPFYSTKPRGSGLGLAISKQIIEAHQGEIVFVSKPHQGSQVTIFLEPES